MHALDWSSVPGALPFLWSGMWLTLRLTVAAGAAGLALGTALALLRFSSHRPLAYAAAAYVHAFRSIPLVMVLQWFFLHEMGFAREVARRVVFMEDGRVVEDTPAAEFFGGPRSGRGRRFLSSVLRR